MLGVTVAVIGGTVCVLQYKQIKKMTINTIAYTYGKYLDYKYIDYHYQVPTNTYHIDHISCVDDGHSKNITIKYNDLKCDALILNRDTLTDTLTDPPAVYFIHYTYGGEEYILPWNTSNHPTIKFPIYGCADLDTCCKIEFDNASCDLDLIAKYAGPKGNFYCDTQYQFTPESIMDNAGSTLCNLKVTTSMGHEYFFDGNQKITIDDDIF
jgi:hypothetical protein